MSLSDDQRKCIEPLLLRIKECPVCSCTLLHLHDDLVVADMTDAQTREATGTGFHLVLLTCDRCGHAMTFSAARIGVIADT